MKIAHYQGKPLNVACGCEYIIIHVVDNQFSSLFIEVATDENGVLLTIGEQIKITEDPFSTIELLKDTVHNEYDKNYILTELAKNYKDNEIVLRMIKLHKSL